MALSLKDEYRFMVLIDIILGILIILGLVRGLMRGLFVEIASLVALIAGIYGAIHFSNYAANFLDEHLDWGENYINLFAFLITFIVIVLLISLAGRALTKIANLAALGLFNKILGGAFGAFKTALILSVLIFIYEHMTTGLPAISEESREESILYEPVKALAPAIFPIILEKGDDLIDELDEELEENT